MRACGIRQNSLLGASGIVTGAGRGGELLQLQIFQMLLLPFGVLLPDITMFLDLGRFPAGQGHGPLRTGHGPHLPPGCIMEFRMGDPLLLGWDMYRDQALLGGDFRQDIFRLTATVLEVTERDIRPPRQSVHNGRGLPADCPVLGKRLRALVDCGSLHTDVQGLTLPRTDWRITDFSGNYAVLDVSACPQAPVTGDHVRFIPSYWAVARTCRMPHIRKTIVHDILPERSLPGTRPVAPHQGTTFLSEVS